ncbi:MAG: hypothetical protein WAT92_00345 [Saprospiraceae bacterium]
MDFLAELILRFGSKSPSFFKIVQIIASILAVITGLPTALTALGLDLPDTWDSWIMKAVSAASIGALFIAKLTVTSEVKKKENIKD